MDLSIFNNKYFLGICSVIIGIIATIVTQLTLNRRGRFRYFVAHNRAGASSNDEVFGTVRVTWKDKGVMSIFLYKK